MGVLIFGLQARDHYCARRGPGRTEDHPASLAAVDALEGQWRMSHVDGQLLPGHGILGLDGWTLEGGESWMPKTDQDFDGSLSDLLQLP